MYPRTSFRLEGRGRWLEIPDSSPTVGDIFSGVSKWNFNLGYLCLPDGFFAGAPILYCVHQPLKMSSSVGNERPGISSHKSLPSSQKEVSA